MRSSPRRPLYSWSGWNHLPDAHRIAMIDDVRYGRDTPAELGEKVAALAFEHGARRIGMIGVVLTPTSPHPENQSGRHAGGSERRLSGFPAGARPLQRWSLVDIASRMNDAAVEALATSFVPVSTSTRCPRSSRTSTTRIGDGTSSTSQ